MFYFTANPYTPGSLEVYLHGILMRIGTDYWENDPARGLFTVKNGLVLDQATMTVYYQVSDPNPSPIPDMTNFYAPTSEPPLPIGVPNGREYRPSYVSQFGWGSEYDSKNAAAAAGSMLLDRQTLGTVIKSPPEIRAASGNTSSPLTLANVSTAMAALSSPAMLLGPVSWSRFIDYVAADRAAIIIGDVSVLRNYGLHPRSETGAIPFTGQSCLLINEVRYDLYCYTYDPSFIYGSTYGVTPAWYPPEVIRAYAATATGSQDSISALYTIRTMRL